MLDETELPTGFTFPYLEKNNTVSDIFWLSRFESPTCNFDSPDLHVRRLLHRSFSLDLTHSLKSTRRRTLRRRLHADACLRWATHAWHPHRRAGCHAAGALVRGSGSRCRIYARRLRRHRRVGSPTLHGRHAGHAPSQQLRPLQLLLQLLLSQLVLYVQAKRDLTFVLLINKSMNNVA